MIKVVAKCTVKNGQVNKFKECCERLLSETKKEEGNISYDLYQDINEENVLTFLEEWESPEILDIHTKTSHFTEVIPQLSELLEKDMEVNIYEKC
ncbi:putative quinol monooxygenase [Clostridium grantii]|uniref:Quinol monooxygenase YgiN n=1 Tax=Clostridium grantii DSM 8605 TaxID=1121316 RepID=A0A1M5VW48_9CLOT|nr:putative quinol monooxygenase [Clostridium grantii]SHH79417.1 Quinol monooxygenase YgiN [Clostridium grantii DSM 8605]